MDYVSPLASFVAAMNKGRRLTFGDDQAVTTSNGPDVHEGKDGIGLQKFHS